MLSDFIKLLGRSPDSIGPMDMGQSGPTPAAAFLEKQPPHVAEECCLEAIRFGIRHYGTAEMSSTLHDAVQVSVERFIPLPSKEWFQIWELARKSRHWSLMHWLFLSDLRTFNPTDRSLLKVQEAISMTDYQKIRCGFLLFYGRMLGRMPCLDFCTIILHMITYERANTEIGDYGVGNVLFGYYIEAVKEGCLPKITRCQLDELSTKHICQILASIDDRSFELFADERIFLHTILGRR